MYHRVIVAWHALVLGQLFNKVNVITEQTSVVFLIVVPDTPKEA
jgi:hypothetical protein